MIYWRAMTALAKVGWLMALVAGSVLPAAENPIRLNSVGFLPDEPKRASVAVAATNFSVIRLRDGAVVFTGPLTGPRTNEDTGEALYTADFSTVQESGTLQLAVPGVGRSPVFRVDPDVYNPAFASAMRAFYFWRCGTAVNLTIDGKTYFHAACHTNDAWLDFATGQHTRTASGGGWHDAGDYNKYVVNAGVSVGTLLRAWEDFGDKLGKIPLNLPPAGAPLPEFLAEIKWELDWLLTMQAADGSVYHKVSTESFGPFIKPEQETEARYFAPWSSESTANFVAMTARGFGRRRKCGRPPVAPTACAISRRVCGPSRPACRPLGITATPVRLAA